MSAIPRASGAWASHAPRASPTCACPPQRGSCWTSGKILLASVFADAPPPPLGPAALRALQFSSDLPKDIIVTSLRRRRRWRRRPASARAGGGHSVQRARGGRRIHRSARKSQGGRWDMQTGRSEDPARIAQSIAAGMLSRASHES
eukprot:5448210-Pyramimonas_sp.AAC.1